MDHSDHVELLREGIEHPGGVWADFGAGTGAFTLALVELAGEESVVHAIDRDATALSRNREAMGVRFPDARVSYHAADFTRPLPLPRLDGIIMANALHFQRDAMAVMSRTRRYLRPGGRLLLVEYNIDWSSAAVPFPVPYEAWQGIARAAGFTGGRLLARRPSRALDEIYSAVAW